MASAGKRRGWTEARTERVLHLIGVQRSPMPAVRGSMHRLDQRVPVRVDGVRPRMLIEHHERHTANPRAATRPGLDAGLVLMQVRRGGSLQRTRLPPDRISPQRANSRGEQSGYNNTELCTGCVPAIRCLMQIQNTLCNTGWALEGKACFRTIVAASWLHAHAPQGAAWTTAALADCTSQSTADCHRFNVAACHINCTPPNSNRACC